MLTGRRDFRFVAAHPWNRISESLPTDCTPNVDVGSFIKSMGARMFFRYCQISSDLPIFALAGVVPWSRKKCCTLVPSGCVAWSQRQARERSSANRCGTMKAPMTSQDRSSVRKRGRGQPTKFREEYVEQVRALCEAGVRDEAVAAVLRGARTEARSQVAESSASVSPGVV